MRNLFLFFVCFFVMVIFSGCDNPTPTQRLMSVQSPTVAYDSNIFVLIRDTGSNTIAGILLTINKDGSGTFLFQPKLNRFPDPQSFMTPIPFDINSSSYSTFGNHYNEKTDYAKNSFNITNLGNILDKIGDVEFVKIVDPCTKSASLGTNLYIMYKGELSPDISCANSDIGGSGISMELYEEVQNLIRQAYSLMSQ